MGRCVTLRGLPSGAAPPPRGRAAGARPRATGRPAPAGPGSPPADLTGPRAPEAPAAPAARPRRPPSSHSLSPRASPAAAGAPGSQSASPRALGRLPGSSFQNSPGSSFQKSPTQGSWKRGAAGGDREVSQPKTEAHAAGASSASWSCAQAALEDGSLLGVTDPAGDPAACSGSNRSPSPAS